MGVHGTFCQLCALPVNHDHYVPTGGALLKIYRGTTEYPDDWDDGENPFPFSADHAWLLDAVGVEHGTNKILRGRVVDGNLTDAASGDTTMPFAGDDDARTYHAYCYAALGSPTDSYLAPIARGTHAWSLVAPYHEQLFEVQLFADDGKAWMLDDPATHARSRDRIAACVVEARRVAAARTEASPATILDLLALDAGWEGVNFHDVSHRRRESLRYRTDIVPDVDVLDFVDLVTVMKEYPGDDLTQPTAAMREQLEAFEVLLKEAIERDRNAIHVATMIGGLHAHAQYFVYARDAATTVAQVRALPGYDTADVSVERDPTWRIYFAEIIPRG